ncbi:hypothetical protein GLOIN_2v1478982 [Rhizophagus clarus]|uniref:Uncharacterized protein n=1 Tax=Rhizophagus clarus TaxID=94130 RepID=A0A8H3R2C0_9GLOM|nr:hypothetical protein GLOIN_2v1478982 [Rhizophagus clarus]
MILHRKPEKETNEINDNSAIDIILEEIRVDYENGNPHLHTALDKFAERYTAAKSKSIPKRRKTEKSGSKKQELLEEKENLNPQIILL